MLTVAGALALALGDELKAKLAELDPTHILAITPEGNLFVIEPTPANVEVLRAQDAVKEYWATGTLSPDNEALFQKHYSHEWSACAGVERGKLSAK